MPAAESFFFSFDSFKTTAPSWATCPETSLFSWMRDSRVLFTAPAPATVARGLPGLLGSSHRYEEQHPSFWPESTGDPDGAAALRTSTDRSNWRARFPSFVKEGISPMTSDDLGD
eukprot:9216127-Pyramimonas_sp.AAC.1